MKIDWIEYWKQLRQKFFDECTQRVYGSNNPRITIAPHDLFEWFKIQFEALQPKTRTGKQNSSMWLFCQWISEIKNDCGEMFVTPVGIEIPWHKDLVMEIYWRPLQEIMLEKKSTTTLDTKEVSMVADALIMHFAQQGYELRFPDFKKFLNEIDKNNYQ